MALNLVYMLPLAPIAWAAGVVVRPRVLLGNGLVALAIASPLKRLTNARLLLAYHGYVSHAGEQWHRILRYALSSCDVAFVNSRTSLDDLQRIMDPAKIVLVPHWADDVFFHVPLRRSPRDRFVILFVGRLDEEKFAQCLRVGKALVSDRTAELWAVGAGSLQHKLADVEGFRWLGYIHDRGALASIYGSADVVWAPADTTYLSLPGIEALAAGCPLIVSDVPAVEVRAKAGERVPRDLIPPEVGRVVDGVDDQEALRVLRDLARSGIARETRLACRTFAAEHHSSGNAQAVIAHLTK